MSNKMNGPAKGPDQKVKKNNGCLQKFVAMFKKNGVAPKDGLKVIKDQLWPAPK